MKLYLLQKQLFIAGYVYIGQMIAGYIAGWSAPVIPKLQDIDQTPLPTVITEQQAAWVASLVYIGGFIGPYLSGFLSNKRGRKPCLLLGAGLSFLSFLVLALSNSLTMIYIARVIGGLATGIIYVVNLVYIGEISSTHIRGILLTCTGVSTRMGTLLVYSSGSYVSLAVTAYIGLALSVAYGSGVLLIPETPLYLALKGEETKAKEVLSQLGRENDVDRVLSAKHDVSKQSIKQEWSEILWIKSNRRAIFITLTLSIMQQLSGVIAVTMFTTTIFELAQSSIPPHLATIVIGVTQLLAATVTPFFVEKSGRKSLLLISVGLCWLSLSVLGTYFYLDHIGNAAVRSVGWLPLVALVMFMVCYDLGFGIIPNTFIGEMFTPNVRSSGSTVSFTVAWLVGFILSSAFAAMIGVGAHVPFFAFAGACAVAFVFTLIFVPETKGKSLVEIQEMLSQ